MVKVDTEQSVKNYDRALTTYTTWEKGYVCLAQFYDRVLQAYSETERDTKGGYVNVLSLCSITVHSVMMKNSNILTCYLLST